MTYRKLYTSFFCLFLVHCMYGQQNESNKLLSLLKNPSDSNVVMVTAHRGDWREAPENSIQSLRNCVIMGVDILELDVRQTKDNQLVVIHDKTIDRTMTALGKVSDYTLDELKQMRLVAPTGHPTRHQIPTFIEMLVEAKGKIFIDIDKGFEYYTSIVPILKEYQMMDQCIFNIPAITYDSLISLHGDIPKDLIIQVIVNPYDLQSLKIIDSYKKHPYVIVQMVFKDESASLLSHIPAIRKHFPVWFNSLWPEHSAGHDDDIAVEESKPDETWGWLIKKGANILQSDRPAQMIEYLKEKGLR